MLKCIIRISNRLKLKITTKISNRISTSKMDTNSMHNRIMTKALAISNQIIMFIIKLKFLNKIKPRTWSLSKIISSCSISMP